MGFSDAVSDVVDYVKYETSHHRRGRLKGASLTQRERRYSAAAAAEGDRRPVEVAVPYWAYRELIWHCY